MRTLFFIKRIYYVFLFLILTGSEMYLGPITAKYVLGLVIFILLIFHDQKLVMDKCFRVYCIFIINFFISSLVCGFLNKFFVTFFNYYFIAYVGWRATNLIIQDNKKNVNYIIYLILGIGAFDVLVTISQMTFNTAWYYPIESFFRFRTQETQIEIIESYAEYRDVLGDAITGVFGNAIKNGWYLAVCSVLSFVFIQKYKYAVLYVLPVFFLIGVFACQERSALAAAVIMISLICYKIFTNLSFAQKTWFIIISVGIGAFLVQYFMDYSAANELRYSEVGMDDTGRIGIMEKYYSYIISNPLFPNYYDMRAQMIPPPHNILFNAFVYGGIISFITICYILKLQFTTFCVIFQNIQLRNNIFFTTSICALVAFTINGFFHNQSIVTGELMPWILWSIIYSIYHMHVCDIQKTTLNKYYE